MIKQILSLTTLSKQYRPSLFTCTPIYFFSSKLDKYMSIKKRNMDRIKKRKTKLVNLQTS